ncbi:MAG: SDR family oxidoreductase [Gammaproteobacteria bacterium]
MKLSEARILLTGATGGLGCAAAERLAAGGASLLLTDRDQARLEEQASRLRALGTTVTFLAGDITCAGDRARLASHARDWRGGVNVLVNNAGLNDFALLTDQDEARIEAMLRVNVLSPILLCRELLPWLSGLPEAHVVNMGSTFGSIGYPGYAPYCATKFAVRGFTEAMRRECADGPVRFHYLAPRAARTALNTDAVNAMNAALGVRMDPPELVADALARLIETDKQESYLGWPERLFVRINGLLPRLVDSSLRKQLPTIKRYATPASHGGTPS